MSTPTVSILTSVYNGGRYLGSAIESILTQTMIDFELILVDDGSIDDTWSIILAYAEKDPRIVSIRLPQNVGTSPALNRGLELAHGAFIARQDGDDISLPNRLVEQLRFLMDHPQFGGVGTDVQLIDDQDQLLGVISYPVQNEEIQKILLEKMCFCGPTLLVRREWFETIGYHFSADLSYSEDYDLCLRLAEVTLLTNIHEPLYLYRQHTSSVSHAKRQIQLFNEAIALNRALQRRYQNNPPTELVELVARDYLKSAYIAFANKDMKSARIALDRAHATAPKLSTEGSTVEEVIRRYVLKYPPHEQHSQVVSVFDELLPRTPHLRRVKARLLSRLHMNQVFVGVDQKDYRRVDEHLWSGIRYDPRWLLNKGVLSLLIKRFLLRGMSE